MAFLKVLVASGNEARTQWGMYSVSARTKSTRVRAAVLAAALLGVPALAPDPAAAEPVVPPAGGVLYVTNAKSHNVSSMAIGQGGTLTLIQTPHNPADTGGLTPRAIVLTPDGATAYVVNSDSDQLSVFRVGPQGALLPNPRIFKTANEPWGAAISPNGRTLYVVSTGDGVTTDGVGTISAYRIGTDRTPSKIGDFKTAADHPKQAVLSPDGRFLYLSYADAEETEDSPLRVITRFPVLPDGSLGSPQGVAKVGQANYGITLSPDGSLLYATSNVQQNVWGFRIGRDGSVKPVAQKPLPVVDPVGLKVTPDGQHLYVTANFDITEPPGSGVLGFTIHADGRLTPAAAAPTSTEGTSTIAITPDGRDLFANQQDANDVFGFTLGSGGTLTPADGSPFPTGGDHPLAQSLAIRPVPAATTQ